ncbi:MAG: hypothetical protein JXD19_11165 [Deltaproteobacteria bacterium]|nr:hypothetical protein [Deltaproteobacteria bacterium]
MRDIITISTITIKESLRDKIFIGLVLFLVMLFLFSVYVSTLSLGTAARFIENTGMLGISLVCLMVSILFGLFSLYREKERNELYVLLNRVPRAHYLLGRLLGTAYIIVIFSFFAGFGIFLLTRFFGDIWVPRLFWAVYWAVLEFTLLIAVGFLFYTLGIGFTLNSLLVLATFIVGHSMNEAIQSFVALGRYGSKLHLLAVKTVSYIFPNFDTFDFRLAIVHAESIPMGAVVLATLYWFFYVAALVALSSFVINRRDI